MARTEKKKDVVVIGLGWTGAILSIELANEGLEVLALERGADRNTVPDFAYPKMADELKYGIRYGLMQKPAKSTVTIRRNGQETALPYRHLGSFLPGDGVGGAGDHWNAQNWRPQEVEWRLRSYIEERFGAGIIPEGMHIQDWGVDYAEVEPFLTRFEYVAGISGKAGNLNGHMIEGGNPFEGPRSKDYPMPPLTDTLDSVMWADAAKRLGLHPFPRPSGHASVPYVNEYGMQMGPCNYCGFCERFGCLNYSKSSPHTAILDAVKQKPNFEYRVNSEVLRIEKAADGKTATGVTYWDEAAGEEVFQPADLVIVAAFQLHNVHLLLLSQLGQAYDPNTGEGVVGRNYAYQMTGGVGMFFKDHHFNPYVGSGSGGQSLDDYSISQIDFAKEGFIGGTYMTGGHTGGRPIGQMSLPKGTPGWGQGWKEAVAEHYGHAMSIASHASHMSYATNHLDLDPTYKDRHGRPLMRMTFNWQANELNMNAWLEQKAIALAKEIGPDSFQSSFKKPGAQYDVRPYQTTHTVGGAVMGTDRKTSVVNRYLQHWDAHNVFVLGASAFPQNTQYNPTGAVGGLAYWAAEAIRKDYLKNPRPLM